MSRGRPLRVAVIDDDEDFLAVAADLVRDAGAEPVTATTVDDAMNLIAERAVDAALTDYRLGNGLGGDSVVRACHGCTPRIPVAVMSVVDSAEVALMLVRLGADDYLLKPSSAMELAPRVRTFLDAAQLDADARAMADASTAGTAAATELLRASAALKPLLHDLPLAARSGANVLVGGESGTGKELAARAVHELSRRAAGAFVAVDCGAIPESLLENEFFGHRKGAYSDAREDREGLAQRADGGTLFLDEIGELPLSMQAKLLRFMQTREYRRLGDSKTARADIRFVAATNRDLRAEVAAGRFREDLYFRLNVIHLRLPALRERVEDIPVLAQTFLHKYAAEFESPALSISRDALDALRRREWPGNVRELENVLQRAVAMARGPVLEISAFAFQEPDAASASRRPSTPTKAAGGTDSSAAGPGAGDFHEQKQAVIEAFEKRYAQDLVRRHEGNLSAAAREAGLDRKSLARLLARHSLDVSGILEP